MRVIAGRGRRLETREPTHVLKHVSERDQTGYLLSFIIEERKSMRNTTISGTNRAWGESRWPCVHMLGKIQLRVRCSQLMRDTTNHVDGSQQATLPAAGLSSVPMTLLTSAAESGLPVQQLGTLECPSCTSSSY